LGINMDGIVVGTSTIKKVAPAKITNVIPLVAVQYLVRIGRLRPAA